MEERHHITRVWINVVPSEEKVFHPLEVDLIWNSSSMFHQAMRMMMRSDLGTKRDRRKRTSESWGRERGWWSWFSMIVFLRPSFLTLSSHLQKEDLVSLRFPSIIERRDPLHLSIVYVLVTHVCCFVLSHYNIHLNVFSWMQREKDHLIRQLISSHVYSVIILVFLLVSISREKREREEKMQFHEWVCLFHSYSSSIISFFTKERKVWKIRFLLPLA